MTTRSGGCGCGALRYEVTADPLALAVCYCSDCQIQSGSAFGMSLVTPADGVRILAGETRSFVRATDSGSTTECFFCPGCGTRIYNAPASMPGFVNVKPGTLDDRSWLAPNLHVWTSSRQPWTPLPADTVCFEKNPPKRG